MGKYIETTDDYRIKYSGCYAKYIGDLDKIGTDSRIVEITDGFYTGDDGKVNKAVVRVFGINSRNKTIVDTVKVPIKDLVLNKFNIGAINLSKSVVVIAQSPNKGVSKYRRLPHTANTYIFDPFAAERDFLNLRKPDTIHDYFITKAWGDELYYPPIEALSEVMSHNRLSCAFNRKYYFGISYTGDGIFLYFDNMKIARVNSKGEIVLKPQIISLREQLSEYGFKIREAS